MQGLSQYKLLVCDFTTFSRKLIEVLNVTIHWIAMYIRVLRLFFLILTCSASHQHFSRVDGDRIAQFITAEKSSQY